VCYAFSSPRPSARSNAGCIFMSCKSAMGNPARVIAPKFRPPVLISSFTRQRPQWVELR
jgi:hypothetical protein